MRRIITGVAIGMLCIATGAHVAQAQAPVPLDPGAAGPTNATGPCTASATVTGGFKIDPYESSGVYEIPLAGSASYEGTVGVAETERAISGSVVIKTPPFVPNITLTDQWEWNGTAVRNKDKGMVSWDLPASLPRDVILTVEGVHNDAGVRCTGSVEIKIEGSPFDTPITPISLGGTALAAAGMAFAIRPKGAA